MGNLMDNITWQKNCVCDYCYSKIKLCTEHWVIFYCCLWKEDSTTKTFGIVRMFFKKETSYAHQAHHLFNQNTVKSVMFWNINTI